MNVRSYRPGDAKALWSIYHDTTHLVNGRDYNPQQCERWAPKDVDMKKWAVRLERTQPFVAEHEGIPIGFAELLPDGAIDFFYCHHQWQRRGVGRQLMKTIECEARQAGLMELRANVSLTAKSFFLSQGFEIVKEQNNIVCGAPAPNYVMLKKLELPK